MIGSFAYRFDEFRFDPREGLSRNGVSVQVPPKEEKLLACLLAAQGMVVSRERIEDLLWPNEVIGYMSLARCVSSLRKILGGQKGRYIQTVPKRGYRFAAEVAAEPASLPDTTIAALQIDDRALSFYTEGVRQASCLPPGNLLRALDCFAVVLRRFPDAAFVHEQVAFCHANQMLRAYAPIGEARCAGIAACEAALRQTRYSPTALALLAWFRGTIPGNADRELAANDDLFVGDRTSVITSFVHMWLLRAVGEVDASVRVGRKAVYGDPFSTMIRTSYSWSLFCANRCGEAMDVVAKQVDDEPWSATSTLFLAIYAAFLGDTTAAMDALREVESLQPMPPVVSAGYSYVLARVGQKAKARRIADGLAGLRGFPAVPLAQLAATYVALGDRVQAQQLLARAHTQGCPSLQPARVDPRLAPLFEEARV